MVFCANRDQQDDGENSQILAMAPVISLHHFRQKGRKEEEDLEDLDFTKPLTTPRKDRILEMLQGFDPSSVRNIYNEIQCSGEISKDDEKKYEQALFDIIKRETHRFRIAIEQLLASPQFITDEERQFLESSFDQMQTAEVLQRYLLVHGLIKHLSTSSPFHSYFFRSEILALVFSEEYSDTLRRTLLLLRTSFFPSQKEMFNRKQHLSFSLHLEKVMNHLWEHGEWPLKDRKLVELFDYIEWKPALKNLHEQRFGNRFFQKKKEDTVVVQNNASVDQIKEKEIPLLTAVIPVQLVLVPSISREESMFDQENIPTLVERVSFEMAPSSAMWQNIAYKLYSQVQNRLSSMEDPRKGLLKEQKNYFLSGDISRFTLARQLLKVGIVKSVEVEYMTKKGEAKKSILFADQTEVVFGFVRMSPVARKNSTYTISLDQVTKFMLRF